MKKILFLLGVTIFLSACGGEGIKDGDFTFNESDFQETYEGISDKIMPDSVVVLDNNMKIDFADKEELTTFLEASGELIDDDKIDKVINTLKDDGLPKGKDFMEGKGDKILITASKSHGDYAGTITAYKD